VGGRREEWRREGGLRRAGRSGKERSTVEESQCVERKKGEGEKTYLNVKRTRHGERNDQVQPAVRRPLNGPKDSSAEPRVEEDDADDLENAELEERGAATRPAGCEKGVREGEEVEAAEAHDEVVELVPAIIED
jgi:hypothetical protein